MRITGPRKGKLDEKISQVKCEEFATWKVTVSTDGLPTESDIKIISKLFARLHHGKKDQKLNFGNLDPESSKKSNGYFLFRSLRYIYHILYIIYTLASRPILLYCSISYIRKGSRKECLLGPKVKKLNKESHQKGQVILDKGIIHVADES